MLPQDPFILLSLVNTKLRDSADTLDELCGDLGIERETLEEKLAAISYAYDEEKRRFC